MLFCRLYGQITSKKMPKEANDSVERQIEELRKAAVNRLILVVLDGSCWFTTDAAIYSS